MNIWTRAVEGEYAPSPSLILHVPHASTTIPEDVRPDFVLGDDELQAELRRITDHYTDELFAAEDDRVVAVALPVSRLVCDPERFEQDSQEPLAARGLGAVYVRTSELKPLRREHCAVSREALLERYYRPHHARLEDEVERGLARHGRALIVDCHSFPLRPLGFEQYAEDERPQICIGTDEHHTDRSLTHRVCGRFLDLGYTVGVNSPFRGSLVPLRHYRKTREVQSIMIELRRDIYMNEVSGERGVRFDVVKEDVTKVLAGLLE